MFRDNTRKAHISSLLCRSNKRGQTPEDWNPTPVGTPGPAAAPIVPPIVALSQKHQKSAHYLHYENQFPTVGIW